MSSFTLTHTFEHMQALQLIWHTERAQLLHEIEAHTAREKQRDQREKEFSDLVSEERRCTMDAIQNLIREKLSLQQQLHQLQEHLFKRSFLAELEAPPTIPASQIPSVIPSPTESASAALAAAEKTELQNLRTQAPLSAQTIQLLTATLNKIQLEKEQLSAENGALRAENTKLKEDNEQLLQRASRTAALSSPSSSVSQSPLSALSISPSASSSPIISVLSVPLHSPPAIPRSPRSVALSPRREAAVAAAANSTRTAAATSSSTSAAAAAGTTSGSGASSPTGAGVHSPPSTSSRRTARRRVAANDTTPAANIENGTAEKLPASQAPTSSAQPTTSARSSPIAESEQSASPTAATTAASESPISTLAIDTSSGSKIPTPVATASPSPSAAVEGTPSTTSTAIVSPNFLESTTTAELPQLPTPVADDEIGRKLVAPMVSPEASNVPTRDHSAANTLPNSPRHTPPPSIQFHEDEQQATKAASSSVSAPSAEGQPSTSELPTASPITGEEIISHPVSPVPEVPVFSVSEPNSQRQNLPLPPLPPDAESH